MKQLTHWIDRTLVGLLITLMALMVVVVTWQVATRYLLNSPSSYTEELATYLLIWISLLGAAYALRIKAHLGIDILVQRLRGRRAVHSTYTIYFAVIVFAVVVFLYGGIRLVYITLTLDQISASLRIPVGYVYTVIPLSGLLMIYYALVAIMEAPSEAAAPRADTQAVAETGEEETP